MASILKVDEMQGVTSAGDITITGEGGSATMQLQQGLTKAWAHSDFASLQDSFNVSSLSDTGNGDNGINYSSSMSSANYSVSVKSQPTSGNDTNLNSIVKYASQSSSAVSGQAGNVAGAVFDCPAIYFAINGDLA